MIPHIIAPVHVPTGTLELKIYDVEIKHLGGYEYQCTAKTNQGDMPVTVPTRGDKPEDMDSRLWASRFSKQEIMAAAKVYTDIWTWHDDSAHFRMMMELFVQFTEGKYENVTHFVEGTIRYNTATSEFELMVNGNWILLQ